VEHICLSQDVLDSPKARCTDATAAIKDGWSCIPVAPSWTVAIVRFPVERPPLIREGRLRRTQEQGGDDEDDSHRARCFRPAAVDFMWKSCGSLLGALDLYHSMSAPERRFLGPRDLPESGG
jgi:hypothetical protein